MKLIIGASKDTSINYSIYATNLYFTYRGFVQGKIWDWESRVFTRCPLTVIQTNPLLSKTQSPKTFIQVVETNLKFEWAVPWSIVRHVEGLGSERTGHLRGYNHAWRNPECESHPDHTGHPETHSKWHHHHSEARLMRRSLCGWRRGLGQETKPNPRSLLSMSANQPSGEQIQILKGVEPSGRDQFLGKPIWRSAYRWRKWWVRRL